MKQQYSKYILFIGVLFYTLVSLFYTTSNVSCQNETLNASKSQNKFGEEKLSFTSNHQIQHAAKNGEIFEIEFEDTDTEPEKIELSKQSYHSTSQEISVTLLSDLLNHSISYSHFLEVFNTRYILYQVFRI